MLVLKGRCIGLTPSDCSHRTNEVDHLGFNARRILLAAEAGVDGGCEPDYSAERDVSGAWWRYKGTMRRVLGCGRG